MTRDDPEAVASIRQLDQFGTLISAQLRERFQTEVQNATGQRRDVTILIAHLSGYAELAGELDSEDFYDLIQPFIQLLSQDIYRYGGTIDQFSGEGLRAIFGAPIASENNAEQAIRAGLDMIADVARITPELSKQSKHSIGIQIGLNSGAVTVGGVGSNQIMNYTAVGETVLHANHIQSLAKVGTILVSESVYQKTKPLFSFRKTEFPPIGDTESAYFEVEGALAHPGSVRGVESLSAPMIGRDAELHRLLIIVSRLAEEGAGSIVFINGEAGIGKSRLIQELKSQIPAKSMDVIDGQARAYQQNVSYWLVFELLRTWLRLEPNMAEAEIKSRLDTTLRRLLGARSASAIPYLEYLLALKPSDPAFTDRIQHLDPNQLRQKIFLSVKDLLIAQSKERPVVLILDDLQWADQASLDLLNFLLQIDPLPPVAVIIASRQNEDRIMERLLTSARQKPDQPITQLHLQSLSPVESQELLKKLLSFPQIPAEVQNEILKRTAGIPFYLEEILRMLIDEGLLQRQEGSWWIADKIDFNTLGIPRSLEGLLLARFDRLPTLERKILQVAAVLGHQFSLELLKNVLLKSRANEISETFSILLSFSLLIDRDFIVRAGSQTDDEYMFKHVLMSEAIYRTLLRRECSAMHGQVAETIEMVYAGRLEEHVDQLAYHYALSDHQNRALRYLVLAAQKASRKYDTQQARKYYEQALELADQVTAPVEWMLQALTGLGDVLVFSGAYGSARERYQAALQLLEEEQANAIDSNWLIEHCQIKRKIGSLYERQGEYEKALLNFNVSLEALDLIESDTSEEKAQILNDMGWVYFRQGRSDDAERCLQQALSLVDENSAPAVVASIFNRLGGVFHQKGALKEARLSLEKSMQLRQGLGDMVAVARSYNNLGLLDWKLGQWDQAYQNFLLSFHQQADLGDIEGLIDLHSNLGLLQLDRGEIENARYHLEEAKAKARQINHPYMVAGTYNYLSRLCLLTGDWHTALEYGHRSLYIFEDMRARDDLPEAYMNIGWAWLGLQDLQAARQAAVKALDCFEPAGEKAPPVISEARGRALRLLGEIAAQSGDQAQAVRLIQESIDMFTSLGNRLELARSLAIQARVACQHQEYEAAQRSIQQARQIFDAFGAKLDLHLLADLEESLP